MSESDMNSIRSTAGSTQWEPSADETLLDRDVRLLPRELVGSGLGVR